MNDEISLPSNCPRSSPDKVCNRLVFLNGLYSGWILILEFEALLNFDRSTISPRI
ncbi:hypothetical protein DSO57_1015277 [Entomophthora muscae]|uniref:Uncharacterized protein n=1 Tax=Entomophthora muscae TaxID=34485 RepID=A0ACC2U3I3_9FUNG|nr:hypothetical protein DSO57_1015277 [Entomophthora muscae]